MLLHRTAVVDGQVRTLTRTWGLLAPFRRSVWRLDEMDQVRVEMSTEVRHGRGGPHVYEVFWVTAFGPDGPLVLDRFRDDRAEAIRLGRRVCRLLGVRSSDRTVDPPLNLEPAQLDESLGHRSLRMGAPATPPRPENCRSSYRETPDGLEVEIPRAGLARFQNLIGVLAGVVAVMLFTHVFCTQVLGGRPLDRYHLMAAALFFPAFLPLFAGYPLWLAWKLENLVEKVRLGRSGLIVDSTMEGHQEIPLEELRELVLLDKSIEISHKKQAMIQMYRAGLLCAGSDRVWVCFGRALGRKELTYLHALLLHKIAALSQRAGGA